MTRDSYYTGQLNRVSFKQKVKIKYLAIGNLNNNIVGYPQIKEENSSTGTDSPEQHQNLYGEKGEEEEKFLVDPSIVMDEEDIEEGQEEVL